MRPPGPGRLAHPLTVLLVSLALLSVDPSSAAPFPHSLSRPVVGASNARVVESGGSDSFEAFSSTAGPRTGQGEGFRALGVEDGSHGGCEVVPEALLDAAGLSREEREIALRYVCWNSTMPADLAPERLAAKNSRDNSGIPPDVTCNPVDWCDHVAGCTQVCAIGSVAVAPWHAHAIAAQTKLNEAQPLCNAAALGTHNTAISRAYGYGHRDHLYGSLLGHLRWALGARSSEFATFDQVLSVSDQLNLGVRFVELDTHWVAGALRIAHCGGLHLPEFNAMIDAINVLAKVLGYPTIHYDSETLGCSPSFSSIAASDQRLVKDVLREISDWLAAHPEEFLILYFDDEMDLLHWNKIPSLMQALHETFLPQLVFTPADKAKLAPGVWPSIKELKAIGKRLLLVSRMDYGDDMSDLMFPRGATICGWVEPNLEQFIPSPSCTAVGAGPGGSTVMLGSDRGRIVRLNGCEIRYGPFNCEGTIGRERHYIDANVTAHAIHCGVNYVCADNLTPTRAVAAIWTWAAGHPFPDPGDAPPTGDCVAVYASTSRWYRVPCGTPPVGACRNIGPIGPRWALAAKGAPCPAGHKPSVPHTLAENQDLTALLKRSGAPMAQLPVYGPTFVIADEAIADERTPPTQYH